MIKVVKTLPAPPSLLSASTSADKARIRSVVASGGTPASDDFKHNIYSAGDVKDQLERDHHNKCAYCESSLAGAYSVVEHYRPKTGYRQSRQDSLHTPGYYWLAYEWTNLLLSCDDCNGQRNKGNLFPISAASRRDIPNENCSYEFPLLLDPCVDDPGDHIEFHGPVVCAKQNEDGTLSEKGDVTITTLNLNERGDLMESRQRVWNDILLTANDLQSSGMTRQEVIEEIIRRYGTDDHPYAGMLRHQADAFWLF